MRVRRRKRGQEVYHSVGWITRERKARVSHEVRLPGGGVLRVVSKCVHTAALESAGRKLDELRRKSGKREPSR